MTDERRMMAKQRKRDNIVNSLLRLQSFARGYIPEQADEVPSRLKYLEKCWDIFQVVQDEYEEMDNTQEFLQDNQETREAMEELYLQTESILTAAVRPTMPVVIKQELPSSSTATVKLPTISLPKFDGDYGAWLTFHDTFESLVHNSTELSDVQKFHYLRAALEGEAAGLIQVLTISSENYTIAWDTLVERYSNKVLLRKKHVRSLLRLPKSTKGSVQAIRSTVDKFKLNLQVLQQLGEPIDENSTIILELLADKLDDASVTAWEESLSPREQPTYGRMIEFLHRRVHTLESMELNRPTPSTNERKTHRDRVSMNAASSREQTCALCGDRHALHQCTKFMNHSQEERVKVIREKRLCANCLRADHTAAKCTNKFSCRQCSGRHHTLIHPGLFPVHEMQSEPAVSTSMLAAANVPPRPSNTTSYSHQNAFLSTVALTIVDARGGEHVARALLDSGSQPNAISERLCQQLRLRRKVVDLAITGVDSTTTSARHQVSAEIRSRDNQYAATLDFIVLRKVTHDIPAAPISTAGWKLPPKTTLADPHFNTVGRIDMIIGAAYFYTFLKEGRIRLFDQGPLLVETVFGWVVTGNSPHIAPKQQSVLRCHFAIVNDSLQGQIEKFWKLEEILVAQPSVEEQECETFFSETVSRSPSGRYIVRLHKHRNHDSMIGISKPAALRRFNLLERKLERKTFVNNIMTS